MPNIEIEKKFASTAKKLFKKHPSKKEKVQKTINRLKEDTFYPSLRTKKYSTSQDIWQSYIEHNTPGAWRIWWQWSTTEENKIIIIGFGKHP